MAIVAEWTQETQKFLFVTMHIMIKPGGYRPYPQRGPNSLESRSAEETKKEAQRV